MSSPTLDNFANYTYSKLPVPNFPTSQHLRLEIFNTALHFLHARCRRLNLRPSHLCRLSLLAASLGLLTSPRFARGEGSGFRAHAAAFAWCGVAILGFGVSDIDYTRTSLIGKRRGFNAYSGWACRCSSPQPAQTVKTLCCEIVNIRATIEYLVALIGLLSFLATW